MSETQLSMASSPIVAVLKRIGSINDKYKSITLDSNTEVTVGRSRDNCYSIIDDIISRKHAIFRFNINNSQWTLESVGQHGVALNKVFVPKHKQIPIQHKDTVAFASISRFSYFFHYPKPEISEEPFPKKICLNQNSLQTSSSFMESFDRTMKNKKIDTQLEMKCDLNGALGNKLNRPKKYNPAEKTKELEEGAARFNFNKENQTLIEHSDVSLNFTTGTAILQEQLERVRHLRKETMNELANVKESYKRLEKELQHDSGKTEDDGMRPNRQFSENNSLCQSQLKNCLIPILDEVEKFKKIFADLTEEIEKLRSHRFGKQNENQTTNLIQVTSANLKIKPEKNLVDRVLLQQKNMSLEEGSRQIESNHRILTEIKKHKEPHIYKSITRKASGSFLKNGKSRVQLSPRRLVKERVSDKLVETRRFVPNHRVCFVYDERMALHRNVKQPEHPEQPARIISVYKKLQESGVFNRCLQLDARIATREELLWLHTADYVDELSTTAKKKQSILNVLERQYDSVFLCPETYQAALLSAGSSLQIVESILKGESRSGVAIIRPPGHHAESDEAFGFCYFNNTALAAKYAIEIHHLERILIIDWDIHHGNGIQKMFEEDPRVLYISLHRLDIFPFNPEKCDCNVVGTGPGIGFTVNIAWPSKGMGDSEYLAAFRRIIMPIANQYNPQLVLVAAGFDAALGDPLGGCKVTPEGYGQMCRMLSSLAEGRVAVLLEGGYNLKSVSDSMMMCSNALLGDPLPTPKIEAIQPEAAVTFQRVVKYLLPYWSSLDVDVHSVEKNKQA